MAMEKVDLRKALQDYKYEFDLLQKLPCSKEENKKYETIVKNNGVLPDGVYAYTYDNVEASQTEFYTVYKPDLTEAEIAEYLTYKQLHLLTTIKNCAVFFVVLAVISILLSFFALNGAF